MIHQCKCGKTYFSKTAAYNHLMISHKTAIQNLKYSYSQFFKTIEESSQNKEQDNKKIKPEVDKIDTSKEGTNKSTSTQHRAKDFGDIDKP